MSLAVPLIVVVAFIVEAAIGFGATLITVTLGALFVPIDALLVAFVPLNLVMSSYLAARHRAHVRWDVLLRRVIPWMGLGLPIGILLFGALDRGVAVRAFGAFVVALAALELLRAPARRDGPAPSRAFEVVLLLLGGVVHGMFATGGPMAVYVLGREIDDKSAFRATLSVLWCALNAVMVASYLASGRLGAETLGTIGPMAIALLVGIVVGEKLHAVIPGAAFRRGVFVMLLVAGAVLALK